MARRQRFNPETGELEDLDASGSRIESPLSGEQRRRSTASQQPPPQSSNGCFRLIAIAIGAWLLISIASSIFKSWQASPTITQTDKTPSAQEFTARLIGGWVQHLGPTEHVFHFFSDGTYTESFYDKKNHQAWLSNGKSWDHHGTWKVSGNTVAMTWEDGSIHSLTLNDITQMEFHTGKATFHRNIESKNIKEAAVSESAPGTPSTADADTLSNAQPLAGPHLQVINVARGDTLMLRAKPMETSTVVAAIPFDFKGIIPLGAAAWNEGTYWLPVQFERYRGYVSSRYVEPVRIKPANTPPARTPPASTPPASTPPVPTPIPVNAPRSAFSEPFPGEHYPQTRLRQLQQEELKKWSAEELRYAINEMYARRGADFANKEIKTTFSKFPWYQPQRGKSYDAAEAEFSAIEKYNVDLLGNYRSSLKSGVPPQPSLPPIPPPIAPTPAPAPKTTRYDGSGKIYKSPDLKNLVGQKLKNAWLYGPFVYREHSGNTLVAVTGTRFILVKEGTTEVRIECAGGFILRPETVEFFRQNLGQPPAPVFDVPQNDPLELLSVEKGANGRLRVQARYHKGIRL